MRETKPTPTIEDYLGIIYTLERDGEEIIGAKLADFFSVSAPTVTVTLKRMVRDGWIRLNEQKSISLTSKGKKAAQSVIRRHMLTEWMLARILDVPWSQIHQEADRMEHSISGDVAGRMQEHFDDPQVCPHGNPMPGFENIAENWRSLIDFENGARVIIRRIHEIAEENPELMRYFEANQIKPGQEAKINEVLHFNEIVTIQIGNKIIPVGFSAAEYIFAENI